jgi:hypothetical protein
MLRRGYHDILVDNYGNVTLLQARRKAYVESTQFFPLHVTVPTITTLCEIEGRFENPRKAPIPQGLKYSSIQIPDPKLVTNKIPTSSVPSHTHLYGTNDSGNKIYRIQ